MLQQVVVVVAQKAGTGGASSLARPPPADTFGICRYCCGPSHSSSFLASAINWNLDPSAEHSPPRTLVLANLRRPEA